MGVGKVEEMQNAKIKMQKLNINHGDTEEIQSRTERTENAEYFATDSHR
jgi:hypothetical protein